MITLETPEGAISGVCEICKFLVKGTSLLENCSYIEKSEVGVLFSLNA